MKLYQPDLGLPATRILFDTQALADRIRSWLDAGQNLTLSISNIRYKPDRSCLVTYVSEDAGLRSFLHAKAFEANDWRTRKRKLMQKDNDALIDDEFAFAIFRFPFDADLPGVEALVTDPKTYLGRVLYDKWNGEEFEQFETLAYKPNRRFTARLKFKSGTSLVLKIHDPPSFARILNMTECLKKPLKGIAPGRAGKSVRHRSFVHAWIAGEACDISKADSGQCEVLMEKVFEFLNRLQSPIVSEVDDLVVSRSTDGIEAITEYLSIIYPPLAEIMASTGKAILAHQSGCQPKTLVHGDFHERQVILSDNGVRACDFDNGSLGDPTSDIANFTGHLHYRACLNEIPMELVGQINDWSMCHLATNADPDALKRFQWNQVAAMFRLATHPFRSGHSNWIEQTEKFIGHLVKQVSLVKRNCDSTVVSAKFDQADLGEAIGGTSIKKSSAAATNTAGCAADVIQKDPAFKFLTEAFDLNMVQHELKRRLPRLLEIYGPYQVSHLAVRRHKTGRRCLLEYELATERGPRYILGKVGAKRLDQYSLEAQSELFDACGFGADSADGVSVPRPLGFCEPWNMWFQERVNATGGEAVLAENRLSSFAGSIAMAKLHSCNFVPCRKHTISDELEILNDRLGRVIMGMPTESIRIDRIQKNCAIIGGIIDARPLTPVHRDFYHDQIMFSPQRTYLVDLDLISLGHPVLDVGNFLAHLAEHGVRHFDNFRQWKAEEDLIAEIYLARMPQFTQWEIEAFKAISFARHIFISWTMAGRRERTSAIIEAAEQLTTDLIPDSHFAKLSG